MEERTDAEICRDRAYEAMIRAETVEDGQALWRLFARYSERCREERARLEIRPPLAGCAQFGGNARNGDG